MGASLTRRIAIVVAAMPMLVLSACDGTSTFPTPSPSTPSATASPSPTPAVTTSVDVYFVIDTRAGLRLARESHDVRVDEAVKGAVARMIVGPDDPDYATTWNPATKVRSVRRHGGVITVDLSAAARTASVGSAGAALMIQQLVFTVAAASHSRDRVLLTIEGEPAGELWGAVSWNAPVARAAAIDVMHLVQIDSLREGQAVSSPVQVSGWAAVFEANLPWRVLDMRGSVVASGNAMTAEGQRFAPYSFSIRLAPGTYTIEITEDDPSGGEGGTPMVDSRAVVVR